MGNWIKLICFGEDDPTTPISHILQTSPVITSNSFTNKESKPSSSVFLKWMQCFIWLYWLWTSCAWQAGATWSPGVNEFATTCCFPRLQICLVVQNKCVYFLVYCVLALNVQGSKLDSSNKTNTIQSGSLNHKANTKSNLRRLSDLQRPVGGVS